MEDFERDVNQELFKRPVTRYRENDSSSSTEETETYVEQKNDEESDIEVHEIEKPMKFDLCGLLENCCITYIIFPLALLYFRIGFFCKVYPREALMISLIMTVSFGIICLLGVMYYLDYSSKIALQ